MNPEKGRLAGRSAIVFGGGVAGAGMGNGKATALLLARESARVAVVDLALDRADDTRAAIEQEGGTAIALRADISDVADVGATDALSRRNAYHGLARPAGARRRRRPLRPQGRLIRNATPSGSHRAVI